MRADPFRRVPIVDFDHPPGQSLFWRISDALDRLVEQLENDSPVGLFFQKVDRDIAAAEEAEDMSRYIPPEKPSTATPPPQDNNKPPDDIHDLRRGRWYDEKPITTTTTPTGGTGMASSGEVRQAIMTAVEKMNEGLGAVQQGHATAEEAQGQFMQATEGSGQGDVSDANGLLAQAVNSLEEVRQQMAAAISRAEEVANRQ